MSNMFRRVLPVTALLGVVLLAVGALALPNTPTPTNNTEMRVVRVRGVEAHIGITENGVNLILTIDWSVLKPAGPVQIVRILVGPNGKCFTSYYNIYEPPSEGVKTITGVLTGSMSPGKYRFILRVYVVSNPALAKPLLNHLHSIDWSKGKEAFKEAGSIGYAIRDLAEQGLAELVGETSIDIDFTPPARLSALNPVTLVGVAMIAPVVFHYVGTVKKEGRSVLAGLSPALPAASRT